MSENTRKFIEKIESKPEVQKLFKELDETAQINEEKVLDAFKNNRVAARTFAPTTGYGYDDVGRDTLNSVFAQVFNAEKALVSPNIVSGTHALTIALFGLLKSGDSLLSITGAPYDTLQDVITGKGNGSLADYGISYKAIEMCENELDFEKIDKYLKHNKPTVVFMTRSRGYSWRDALSIDRIYDIVSFVRSRSPESLIVTDNCYGEFIETREPTAVGADVIIGSLIKNPGGGLAPTGGYVAGKAEFIDKIANRLTAPSIGAEVGSYYASYVPFFEGLFFAPVVVKNAIKGSILTAFAYSELGYEVSPSPEKKPSDIIRAIKFNTAEELISFIQGIQSVSPVDSYVTPEPWDMPGYRDQVIMAAGSFIQGASIELSADAPIRKPYIAYLQGGLTYEHLKYALKKCLEKILQ